MYGKTGLSFVLNVIAYSITDKYIKLGHFAGILKELHPEFQVLAGKTSDETAGVFFRGERLFTIPNNDIYEHPIATYGVETSSGFIHHRTTVDALAMAKKVMQDMKNNHEEYEATMGLGKFSDANLKAGNEQQTLADDQAYEAKQKESKGGVLLP